MYSRPILAVLGSVSVVLLTSAFTFQVRAPFTGGGQGSVMKVADVVRSVDGSLNTLNRQVHSRMPASAKVEMLKQTLSSIEEVRKQNSVQTVDKEVYLDYSTASLEHVATDGAFSVEKCPEYKARVMIDFEPYAEHRPTHPALKRSYEIIEGICS
ncbi:hypothetical protein EZJ49_07805 [Bdellovibrio bacteriovorus]|uniref:hypothetical protein n=1 Tax=Bdellovibrio bacteriovorus TaxID=959 RepID=UPI0021D23864|nr:hypothetical protein [Bdellovibrio bacteriovorus]UXR66153.1 hypothetical protein EZJ49_07805 [Bdellovibrio bacteriovorus]